MLNSFTKSQMLGLYLGKAEMFCWECSFHYLFYQPITFLSVCIKACWLGFNFSIIPFFYCYFWDISETAMNSNPLISNHSHHLLYSIIEPRFVTPPNKFWYRKETFINIMFLLLLLLLFHADKKKLAWDILKITEQARLTI